MQGNQALLPSDYPMLKEAEREKTDGLGWPMALGQRRIKCFNEKMSLFLKKEPSPVSCGFGYRSRLNKSHFWKTK